MVADCTNEIARVTSMSISSQSRRCWVRRLVKLAVTDAVNMESSVVTV